MKNKMKNVLVVSVAGLLMVGLILIQILFGGLGVYLLSYGLLGEPIAFLDSLRISVGITLLIGAIRKGSK